MDRRNFIKAAGLASVFSALPTSFNLKAGQAGFEGKFLITVQADGGWDVSSLCDPKMNVPGELKINNWADADETRTAGNIQYAPFGTNQNFFEKYHQDMLVINGIDSQTNSHTTGVVHNWSGRISNGFPSITALYATANAPDLPISYINNGGYAETAGITRYTRLDDAYSIKNIVEPNSTTYDPNIHRVSVDDWQLITQSRNERMTEKLSQKDLTFRERLAVTNYKSALDNASILKDFSTELGQAGELQDWEQFTNFGSSLKRQGELALIAMKSGVAVAADLHVGGIADRIVMVVMSDFSRTPYYNDTEGKDHWPVGSAIIMERDASWGNRMVGLTDEAQNIIPINPATMQPDANSGKVIYPKHVMQSFREYMGVADHSLAQPFKFNNDESFNFFNADVSTPQGVDPRNLVRV